jgi:hypothetical protein
VSQKGAVVTSLEVRYQRADVDVTVYITQQPAFALGATSAPAWWDEGGGGAQYADYLSTLGREVDGIALADDEAFKSFMDELTSLVAIQIRAWCVQPRWQGLKTRLDALKSAGSVLEYQERND